MQPKLNRKTAMEPRVSFPSYVVNNLSVVISTSKQNKTKQNETGIYIFFTYK